MEKNALFPVIVVTSLKLAFGEYGSSFATHSVAFFRVCSFRSGVCSVISSSSSVCVQKKFFHLKYPRKLLSPQKVLPVHPPGF